MTMLHSNDVIERSPGEEVLENFNGYVQMIDQASEAPSLIHLIINEFAPRIRSYLTTSDLVFEKITGQQTRQQPELADSYLLHYRLPEHLKNIALLHRDVLLQLTIGRCKEYDNQLNIDSVERHFISSRHTLSEAVASFIQITREELKTLSASEIKPPPYLKEIKHQQNPWQVYSKQFQTILDQMSEIDRSSIAVMEVVDAFRSLKDYVGSLTRKITEHLDSSIQIINQGITKLNNIKDIKDLNQEILWIDKIIEDRQSTTDHQKDFVSQVESKTKNLNTLNIPIATSDGLLLKRKLDLNKVTNKWLEYELLPFLIDLWDNSRSLDSYLDHNLINLKSGLTLAGNSQSPASLKAQIDFLQNLDTSIRKNIEHQHAAVEKIERLVNNSLIATKIYQEEEFLEVSLQSSFAQYTTVKNTVLDRVKHRLSNLFTDLGSKYEEAHMISSQKRLEASIECIGYRMLQEENTSYDSLFRNKIFIGDLFLVAREEEEKMFTQSLKQWQTGFNQSALVVGNHLSGRTTFLEYIAKKYFGRKVIKLEVTGSVSVDGRKFQTNYSLREVLKFIKNNLYQSKPLIIIDDLEIWRNEEYTLLDNVRALIKFIESESDNAFVMVSISQPMQDHLDHRLSFSDSFGSVINVDRSTSEEIMEAVLLRHGASHKDLITPDRQSLPPKQVERKIKELCRDLNYNMGRVLQAWTYRSTVVDDQFVIFEDKDYTFRDFFTNEEIIILKFVVLYKHINEVVLKNFLGTRNEIYMSGLKRLVNTKVLLRNEEGELQLNTVIYHDVIDILKFRGILS